VWRCQPLREKHTIKEEQMALQPEVLTQMQSLVAPLNTDERRAMIEAIAKMTPANETENSLHHRELLAEQRAWFAKPIEERRECRDEYVAVRSLRSGRSRPADKALYLRVRASFGRHPALITYANWTQPRVFTFRSIRQEQ